MSNLQMTASLRPTASSSTGLNQSRSEFNSSGFDASGFNSPTPIAPTSGERAGGESASINRPQPMQPSLLEDALDWIVEPIRGWLDAVKVCDPEAARILYKLIPGQCPFERDVTMFGRKLFHIPPMCKLNPFYDQLVAIRFRAMCYLVDECGETL
jgi:Mo-dependent nitrogenase C-terminus